ncbi:MAG: transglycosylase SLT domain-containing protein, partial [bacterium]|nr:transglycosylase SLT domain-containing protein [bacterium]
MRTIVLLLCFWSLQLNAARELFPRPSELLPNIKFWTNVYGVWTTEQIAFTDSEDLSLVYRVVTVPALGERINGKTRDQWIKDYRAELIEVLKEIEVIQPRSEKEVTGLAREVYLAIRDNRRGDKYRRIDYIRAQNGLRNRFEHGYMLSGAHEMEIKARLRQFDLPEELIAIVFVESLFYSSSKSSAGAAGIWQFMRHTGKEFLHINDLVDERYDPIIATEAAIQYVITAKQKLGEWPLIITSYNHGRAGMLRAVNQVNSSDLVE